MCFFCEFFVEFDVLLLNDCFVYLDYYVSLV